MSTIFDFEEHAKAYAPSSKQLTNSGTSATYQAAGDDVGKLHVFSSAVACMVERGTGSSVTVTNGVLIPANTLFYFRPYTNVESLGYKTLSGSAYSASDVATVGLVSI